MMNPPIPTNPKAIAEAGQKIYDGRYRAKYEATHFGKFVAINIRTSEATLGDTPEDALASAKKADPSGLFHLIKVGSAGAFQVSHTLHAYDDWLHG